MKIAKVFGETSESGLELDTKREWNKGPDQQEVPWGPQHLIRRE